MLNNAANLVKGAVQSGPVSSIKGEGAGRIQRREMRFQCDPASVLLEAAGHPEPAEGQIVEVSKTGLKLRLRTSSHATSESVRITHARMIVNGQIRHYRPNDDGAFDTGVEIVDVRHAD
jgi:hypothetical protein